MSPHSLFIAELVLSMSNSCRWRILFATPLRKRLHEFRRLREDFVRVRNGIEDFRSAERNGKQDCIVMNTGNFEMQLISESTSLCNFDNCTRDQMQN
jgi:hypothetical protein